MQKFLSPSLPLAGRTMQAPACDVDGDIVDGRMGIIAYTRFGILFYQVRERERERERGRERDRLYLYEV